MSSIGYVEIARKGDLDHVVTMGQANVREVEASGPHRSARLRVYSPRVHGESTFTLFSSWFVFALVDRLAQPNSELRNMLVHLSTSYRYRTPQFFLRARNYEADRFERLHAHSWSELEPHWRLASDYGLLILAEGPRGDLLKLLDSIYREAQATRAADLLPVQPAPVVAPKPDPHQEAIAFRDELLSRDWPDGKRVAEMAGTGSRTNPHQYAARQRSNRSLLGVWVAGERTYRHPDFQFDEYGAIRPSVADLLKVLPSDEEDRNGWRRAFWVYSPHPLLSGEMPAEVFARDPGRVIEVARREFCGDPNEHW